MDPFFAALIAVGFMGAVFVVFGVLPEWLQRSRTGNVEPGGH